MIQQPVIRKNSEAETNNVEEKVAVVVNSNAVVDPGTMARVLLAMPNLYEADKLTGHAWQHIVGIYGSACFVEASESCT